MKLTINVLGREILAVQLTDSHGLAADETDGTDLLQDAGETFGFHGGPNGTQERAWDPHVEHPIGTTR